MLASRAKANESSSRPLPTMAGDQQEQSTQDKASRESAAQLGQEKQALWFEDSTRSGCQQVVWRVDAHKLHGSTKLVESPLFKVCLDNGKLNKPFCITLTSRQVGHGKSGAVSFEAARGRGYVQLKCQGQLSREVLFYVSVGNGKDKKYTRGPIQHNFSKSSVGRLPKGNDEWNLFSMTDPESDSFFITMEITSSTEIGPSHLGRA